MTDVDARPDRESGESPVAARFHRVTAFRDRIRSRPGGALAWRIGVTVVGVAVVVGGIILLPLPGPGWLIIFAGLGILATEYEWARRLLGFARTQLAHWTDWVKRQPRWLQAVVGLLGAAFLALVFFLVWLVLYR
jgi:uncharacterized protein (TIGR02611 family)